MKSMCRFACFGLINFTITFISVATACAQPLTADFTYQGRLASDGNPASGSFDLRFALYNAPAQGTLVAGPVTNASVSVTGGLFTVGMNFGTNAFDGNVRWMEIGVRPAGAPSGFSTLSPRQSITAAPYAWRAQQAASADMANNVPVSFWQANSNNLNYTINATNWPPAWDAARLRNLRTNASPAIINVKDFGALGIGGDDSVALAAAFRAWTNRGGTLYFPAGTYVDTNTYAIGVLGAYDSSPWSGLDIRGEGQAITKWNVQITNATFIWITNYPLGLANLRVTDVGEGTNHFFRMCGAPQGLIAWDFCTITGFKGYGADFASQDLGEMRDARFDSCGVGFRIGGFGDGWNGSAEVTKSIWAGCIIGFSNSWSYGQRFTQGHNWFLTGNLNNNGIIVGPGYGSSFAGAFESVTNTLFAIGYPPGLPGWIDAPQDAIGIGTVRIHDLNLLNNGASGSALIKLYANPGALVLDNVSVTGGLLVQSTSPACDTTPIDLRGCWAATNMLFSDNSYILGGWMLAGRQNALVNSTIWVYNKTNNTPVGMANGVIEPAKSPEPP